VRALALRSDDFRELCDEDAELAEALLDALGSEISGRLSGHNTANAVRDDRAPTEPLGPEEPSPHPSRWFAKPDTPAIPENNDNVPVGAPGVSPTGVTPPAGLPAIPEPIPVTKPLTSIPAVLAKPVLAEGAPRRAQTSPPETASQPRHVPRRNTPPGSLIVPATERADADAAFDDALHNITIGGVSNPVRRPDAAPAAAPPAEPEDDQEEPREIVVEADEPAPRPVRVVAKPRILNFSEPEISIERLVEMEAEDPDDEPGDRATTEVNADSPAQRTEQAEPSERTVQADEPSQPEIQIFQDGRAITANEIAEASGATDKTRPPK
jgi:hypothetical protein